MTTGDGDLAVMDVEDIPRTPHVHPTTGDRIFRGLATAAASVSLIIVGGTLIFLFDNARPAFAKSGVKNFFTDSVWNPGLGHFGVLGLLEGTLIIAAVAMVIAVPLGVAMALFINEYAPAQIRRVLTSMIDLLAALPSLLFGIWGFFALQKHLVPIAQFLADHLSALPFLQTKHGATLTGSSFVAGFVVAIMIMPIITSVTRDVMAQVPRGAVRRRARVGWNTLGNDPRGHPALRPGRNRRCFAAGLRPGAGRDDCGRTDHQPAGRVQFEDPDDGRLLGRRAYRGALR